MSVRFDLEIDVQKIIQCHETHWDFNFADTIAPDELLKAFEMTKEKIDFNNWDKFGDLNSFFGLNIEFNPQLWALVWGGGYNVQFNLYADTYDEKCVNVFASLGLAVLLCRCERNNRTLQAAKLIMKARDKALLLLRTQPKRLRKDEAEIDADILKLQQSREAKRAEIAEKLKKSSELLGKELETLAARSEEQRRALKAYLEANRLQLQEKLHNKRIMLEAALAELKVREVTEPEALERKEQEELKSFEERQEAEKERLKKRLEDEHKYEQRALSLTPTLTISSVDREAFAYTEEQRKANKARASAIRLKARTMSFVDKRSIR